MHQTAIEVAATVIGAGVDCHRMSDFRHTFALMDVTVQAQERLHLFDYLANCGASGGDLMRTPPLGHVAKVLINLIGGVEAAFPGRHVDIEDRPFWSLQLID